MWLRSYDFIDVHNPLNLREVLISWNRNKVRKREVKIIRWVTCVHHTSRCQEPLPYRCRKSSSAVLCGTNFTYLHSPLSQIFQKSDEQYSNRFSVDSESILCVFDCLWSAVHDILQLFWTDNNIRLPTLCINCKDLKCLSDILNWQMKSAHKMQLYVLMQLQAFHLCLYLF